MIQQADGTQPDVTVLFSGIGKRGDAPTRAEILLLSSPVPGRVDSTHARVHALAHRINLSLIEQGHSPDAARDATAVAVMAMLDEFGSERVRIPTREWFSWYLLKPAVPAMVDGLESPPSIAEICAWLGISRRTFERMRHRWPTAAASKCGGLRA